MPGCAASGGLVPSGQPARRSVLLRFTPGHNTEMTETFRVGVVMGSRSDWDTMQHASKTLDELGIAHDVRALSAHRTPDALVAWMKQTEAAGAQVFIAAAGGAAHLAGVVASKTILPVLGVPMKAWSLDGLDSLLSTVQMPRGIPVGTLAIGKAGAVNAALLAAQILALRDSALREKLEALRKQQTADVVANADPRKG